MVNIYYNFRKRTAMKAVHSLWPVHHLRIGSPSKNCKCTTTQSLFLVPQVAVAEIPRYQIRKIAPLPPFLAPALGKNCRRCCRSCKKIRVLRLPGSIGWPCVCICLFRQVAGDAAIPGPANWWLALAPHHPGHPPHILPPTTPATLSTSPALARGEARRGQSRWDRRPATSSQETLWVELQHRALSFTSAVCGCWVFLWGVGYDRPLKNSRWDRPQQNSSWALLQMIGLLWRLSWP